MEVLVNIVFDFLSEIVSTEGCRLIFLSAGLPFLFVINRKWCKDSLLFCVICRFNYKANDFFLYCSLFPSIFCNEFWSLIASVC